MIELARDGLRLDRHQALLHWDEFQVQVEPGFPAGEMALLILAGEAIWL